MRRAHRQKKVPLLARVIAIKDQRDDYLISYLYPLILSLSCSKITQIRKIRLFGFHIHTVRTLRNHPCHQQRVTNPTAPPPFAKAKAQGDEREKLCAAWL